MTRDGGGRLAPGMGRGHAEPLSLSWSFITTLTGCDVKICLKLFSWGAGLPDKRLQSAQTLLYRGAIHSATCLKRRGAYKTQAFSVRFD
jgi:hypothetical protein